MYAQMEPDRLEEREEMLASIHRFYPSYGVAARYSRQYVGLYRAVTVDAKSQLQLLILIFSIIILLWFLLKEKLPPLQTLFTLLIVFSLLANALVVVSCWGFEDRLQSRVTWLLTLPVSWLFFTTWDNWRQNYGRTPRVNSYLPQKDS
ncbi:MAG: hypothetical protein ACRBFS_23800, partial [Aureispira sp.]